MNTGRRKGKRCAIKEGHWKRFGSKGGKRGMGDGMDQKGRKRLEPPTVKDKRSQ